MAIALANPATMVHPHYSSITLPLQTISHFWLQHLVKYNLWYPVYRSAHHFSQLRSIQKSPKLHPVLKAPKFHRHFGSLKEAMTTSPSWPKKLHALQGKSSSCASNWGLLQGHVMTCDTIGNPIPLMLNTPRNHGPQYVEFLHEPWFLGISLPMISYAITWYIVYGTAGIAQPQLEAATFLDVPVAASAKRWQHRDEWFGPWDQAEEYHRSFDDFWRYDSSDCVIYIYIFIQYIFI